MCLPLINLLLSVCTQRAKTTFDGAATTTTSFDRLLAIMSMAAKMDLRVRVKTLLLWLGSGAAFLLFYISVSTTTGPAGNGIVYFTANLSSLIALQTALSVNETGRCRRKVNVMFLKTHKCASSTVQNILMRYADLRNLTIVLPPDGNYLGHPVKFMANFTLPLPSVYSHHYNIFCHHTRWHEGNIRSIMPADTVFISILKEPAAMFESLYNWVKLDVRYGVPLETFIEDPLKHYKNSSIKDFARNPMMFDFGLDREDFQNPVAIQAKIAEIDRRFGLIMLSEFVDESLILLRELLCWEWEDIVVFRINSRRSEYKKRLSPYVQARIREWNSADHQLYQHFRERFHAETRRYGLTRMAEDLRLLRNLTREWYDFCVARNVARNETQDLRFQVWHPTVTGFQLTESGLRNPVCVRLAMAENPYTDALRAKLWPAFVMSKLIKPQKANDFW